MSTFAETRAVVERAILLAAKLPAYTPNGNGQLAEVRCHLHAALDALRGWPDAPKGEGEPDESAPTCT